MSQMNNGQGMMLQLNDIYQGGPIVGSGITQDMINCNQR